MGVGLSFHLTLSPHREASTVAYRVHAPPQLQDPHSGVSPSSRQVPQVYTPPNCTLPWEISIHLTSGGKGQHFPIHQN